MARAHPKKTWAALRSAYRRGEGTIAALAPKFGIPERTAAEKCRRERWTVERGEVAEEASSRAREQDTETLAAMLARHRSFANKLLRLGMAKVEEAEAEGRHISANLLDTMAGVLASAARQERLAAGIEPAKPVLAFETAGAGAVLRVKRRRNSAVPEPGTA